MMHGFIHRMIRSIANGTTPVSYTDLETLLLPRPQHLHGLADVPTDLRDEWTYLCTLVTRLENRNTLLQTRQQAGKHALRLKKQATERARLETLESRARELETASDRLFDESFARFNKTALTNPLVPVFKPIDPQRRLSLLREYEASWSCQLQLLQNQDMRWELHNRQIKQSQLIAELQQSNAIFTADKLTGVREATRACVQRLQDINKAMSTQMADLTTLVTQRDIAPKVLERAMEYDDLIAQHDRLAQQLLQYPISAEARKQAVMDYEAADNKDAFLTLRKQAVAANGSYTHLRSWYGWATDSGFADKCTEQQTILNYLDLWHQRQTIDTQARALYVPSVSDSVTDRALCERIRTLLHQYDPDMSLKQFGIIGLWIRLNRVLPQLQTTMEQSRQTLVRLDEMQGNADAIVRLQATIHLKNQATITSLTSESLEQLRDGALLRSDQLASLNKTLTDCQTGIRVLSELEACQSEQSAASRSLKQLEKRIRQYEAQATTFQNPAWSLETIEREIDETVQKLRLCAQSRQTEIIQPVSRAASSMPIPDESFDDEPPPHLQATHQLIMSSLADPDDESGIWYGQLYQALSDESARTGEQHHQMERLLNDILFELQHPLAPGLSDTLQAYRNLCPNPAHDWPRLTSLKPPLPLLRQESDALPPVLIRAQLVQLREQGARLRRKHEREALLLEQLTDQLEAMACLANQAPNQAVTDSLQHILSDPRYHSLQQHRGFHQLGEWLAKLCTQILGLFCEQTPTSYQQRFCFRPTRSINLATETLGLLEQELTPH